MPTGRTAARLGGAVGLVTLLLVALLRGGDGSDLVSESTRAVTPSVSQFLDVPAPNSAAQVHDIPDVLSQIPNEAAADGDPPSRLSALRSAVGSDVIDREVVGRSDTFVVGTRVVFWTHVAGGRGGDTIRHVWSHDGKEVGVTVLPVESPSWRTQSRHTLVPESEGDWVVELQDSEGRTLASHQFRCENPGQARPGSRPR